MGKYTEAEDEFTEEQIKQLLQSAQHNIQRVLETDLTSATEETLGCCFEWLVETRDDHIQPVISELIRWQTKAYHRQQFREYAQQKLEKLLANPDVMAGFAKHGISKETLREIFKTTE
jgi:uncharacterized membrane-anchored protein YjiN (DUF445 family)